MKPGILTQLAQAAEKCGVQVINRGNGHFQLQGPHLLVNYYPLSKNRTAYVAGTKKGMPNCDAQQAVAMAATAVADKDDCSNGLRVDESSTFTLYGRIVTEAEFRAAPSPTGASPPWDTA